MKSLYMDDNISFYSLSIYEDVTMMKCWSNTRSMRFRLAGLKIAALTLGLLTIIGTFGSTPLQAQGAMTLPMNLTADNGSAGICFDVTAQRSVRIHRFWSQGSAGTNTVEIYYNPNGLITVPNSSTGYNANGWISLGQANFTGVGYGTDVEIPLNIDLLMNQGDRYGFAIRAVSGGVSYRSGVPPYIISDSYLSVNTQGWGGGVPLTNQFVNWPRQFCGRIKYDPGVTAPNDAGIVSIDSPKNFCAGTLPVSVTLRNSGTIALTSVAINWTLNGVPQTTVNWTGLLDTLNVATRETSVTLAMLPFAAGVPYTIRAWTSNPNGMADTVNTNDSAMVTVKAALSGVFTVGGSSPDYATLTAAVADLVANGVCGPVRYNLRTGMYNEQVSLGQIPGTSSVNTVTFASETGNKADVNVTFASSLTAANYTIQYNGCSWVTFRDMTITATGATYGTAFDIRSNSLNCTIDNLNLTGVPTTTSTSTNLAVVYSPSGSLDNNLLIRNSTVRNGSCGLYLYGSSTTALETGVIIENNTVLDFAYYGVMMYYMDAPIARDNYIRTDASYSTAYLFNAMYCDNALRVLRNTIIGNGTGTKYGMRIYYSDGAPGLEGLVANNFVAINNGTSNHYSLYPYYSNYQRYYHNTIYSSSTYATGYLVYFYGGSNNEFLNNIFYNAGGGYAWYSGTNPAPVIASDYNVLYTTGPTIAYWNGAARATLNDLTAASGFDQNSITKVVNFVNPAVGNLHLGAGSEDDDDLLGTLLQNVTDDIDHDPRVRPYRGADEACYILPNSHAYYFVDGNGNPLSFVELPGTVGVSYSINFPDFAANVQMTANFYSVPGNTLEYSTTFSAQKLAGQTLNGVEYLQLPASLPVGYYRVEIVFNAKNSCGYYRNYMPYPSSILLVGSGATPCEVWPGDVNNDGVVNYSDRKDLNEYIHDANLRTLWLNGPARYRADAMQNPLTYIAWQPQAGAPWFTAEGCYMDADGNGVVNNFDYLAIKMNWTRTHGGVAPRNDNGFSASTFDMSQNYPNPFNPATTIQYSVPERSSVQLRISDMLGRVINTPVHGIIDAGLYTFQFDGANLPSGHYIATITMNGSESGLTFSKTIRMTLSK